MDRLTRSIERKANQINQKNRLQPKTDKDREYRTSLVIFDTLMRFESEVQQQRLTGTDRGRLADEMADKASAEIRKLWRGGSY